jgi:hypothetical protein
VIATWIEKQLDRCLLRAKRTRRALARDARDGPVGNLVMNLNRHFDRSVFIWRDRCWMKGDDYTQGVNACTGQ